MKLEKILKSNALFYVAVVLMIINVVGYVSVGSMECVIVFAIATYVANHFTKNRAVDIFVGLFIANVLFGCGRVKEGFEADHEKLKKIGASQHTAAKACAAGQSRVGGVCKPDLLGGGKKKKEKQHKAAAQHATAASALAKNASTK